MRLFVAIDLPKRFADDIAALQARFGEARGLRFTNPEQAHVTLQFLGDVDNDRLPALEDALESAVDAASVAPFEATVGGLGVFPSLDYISVVWVGVRQGGAEMSHLYEAVLGETEPLGFDPSDHTFTPHVTLARMDNARGKDVVTRVVREEDPTVGSFSVGEIRLKQSELTDEGPRYSTVSRFAL